jgi:two-component system sensor histidine kinase ChiS
MSLAGINDVLWGIGILHTPILVPVATFVFILIYSTLISRRFSLAFTGAERLALELIENQRLRDEMQVRIKQEQDLRQVQRQLTELLHTVDDALCTVYDNGEITFCNRAFEELTGFSSATLAGKQLELIPGIKYNESEENSNIISPVIERGEKWFRRVTLIDAQGKHLVCDIVKIPLELEDEQLSVLVFRIPGIENAKNISAISFIEALNRNRNRIQSLEEMMTSVTPDLLQANPKLGHELKMIDTNLEQMGRLLINDQEIEKKKQLGSEIINLAIQYWIESTGKTKNDLARESNLWKVQINQDGWERTQTLDRYLDIKTFPKLPRWNQITKTTDFVLIRCSVQSPLREQLEIALQKLHVLS